MKTALETLMKQAAIVGQRLHEGVPVQELEGDLRGIISSLGLLERNPNSKARPGQPAWIQSGQSYTPAILDDKTPEIVDEAFYEFQALFRKYRARGLRLHSRVKGGSEMGACDFRYVYKGKPGR